VILLLAEKIIVSISLLMSLLIKKFESTVFLLFLQQLICDLSAIHP